MDGKELKQLRDKTKLPATWLAEFVGRITRDQWYKYESGKSPVPDAVAKRMVKLDKFINESLND